MKQGRLPGRGRDAETSRPRLDSARGGFSLVELLAVALIIGILVAVASNPNRAGRQRSLKAACAKKLQTLYVSLQVYARDHADQFPAAAGARSSEEAWNVLVPAYAADPSVFICPGSKDSVPAADKPLTSGRISYAYYMGRGLTDPQRALASDRQVDNLARTPGQPAFSTTGRPPGNNHRGFGGNFLFCDGSVETTAAAPPFALPLTGSEVLLNPR